MENNDVYFWGDKRASEQNHLGLSGDNKIVSPSTKNQLKLLEKKNKKFN